MAESVNKYPKRVEFCKGEQRKFINLVITKTGTNPEKLAALIKVHPRTIRDWRREKFNLSMPALKIFCKTAKLKIPQKIRIKKPFSDLKIAAKSGWRAVIKKYGYFPKNEEYRKKKWYEWWNKEGQSKYPRLFKLLPFNKPRLSIKLAEFMGIMMGDGSLTPSQLTITLNDKDDYKYSRYVIKLTQKLFRVKPSVYHYKKDSIFDIVLSRSGLVKHLNKLGLKIGNKIKQELDIPPWIMNNRKYRIACLRGLVDTDGCVIIHQYKSSGIDYVYKKIAFTSRSKPLLKSVGDILDEYGIKYRIGGKPYDIRIEAINNVKKYFKIVGTHNPKHLKRYLS